MEVVFLAADELEVRRPHTEGVLLALPYTDAAAAARCARLLAWRAGTDGVVLAIEDRARAGMVATVNRAFRYSSSPFFGYAAQDAFAGRDWASMALRLLQRGVGLVGFNDGKWNGALAGFGLTRRAWAQTNYSGDFFYPGYRRHYADAELTVLALAQRAYAYDPNCLMVEVDWAKDTRDVDAQDRALYRTRAEDGFEGRVASLRLRSLFA